MPRLPSTLRVPDPRGPVAGVSGVHERGSPEADVGLRGAVEHPREVVLGPADERRQRPRRMRRVRRPARPGRLQHELSAAELRIWNLDFGIRTAIPNSEFLILKWAIRLTAVTATGC